MTKLNEQWMAFPDPLGNTALHYFCISGGIDAVENIQKLVNDGDDINARNIDGCTPLYIASDKGHEEIVTFLVAVGANIHIKDSEGWTPLHIASAGGNSKIIELLLAAGANVNDTDHYGNTPLHVASSKGYKKGVELLIAAGANIKKKNDNGENPLDIVLRLEFMEIALILIDADCDIQKISSFIAEADDINKEDNTDKTPICHNSELLKSYVNYQDKEGNTALHLLCMMRGDNDLEDLQMLMDGGADINIKNNDGETPLDCAIKHEHHHIVDYFKNIDRQRALDYAVKFGLDDIVDHLTDE